MSKPHTHTTISLRLSDVLLKQIASAVKAAYPSIRDRTQFIEIAVNEFLKGYPDTNGKTSGTEK
jgi:hypothetical protein